MKYLKLFKTTDAYNAAIDDLGFPNVSHCEDNKEVHYNLVPPPFFAKLSLNNGEIVKLQGSGELTQAMVGQYQTTVVNAEIGELCTSIGEKAFQQCGDLTSVTISNSVINISNNAFNNCSNLVSIVVDSTNTVYDSRDNCNAIINKSTNELVVGCKNTVIPNTVTSIGDFAFYNCIGLTSIIIPSSVMSIGRDAFYACFGLTSITIPNSVTSIGYEAFNRCTGLTSITIPNSVTNIDQGAFMNCMGLISITIPNSVTNINRLVFASCTSLTSVTIPNSITSIGSSAFSSCSNLTSITIPESITSINNTAFQRCSNLVSITCNATTAPTIKYNTFECIKRNGTLTVPNGSTGYDVWMGTTADYLGYYNWTKREQ